MRPAAAWSALGALATLNALAFLAPTPYLAPATLAAWLAVRRGRTGLVAFAATTLAINAVLLAALSSEGPALALGPLHLSGPGALDGLAGGLRLVAVVVANAAVLSWVPPPRLLEGLRLPRAWTGFLAAVLIAGQDIGRDHARLRDARRLEGGWPETRLARVAASARLLPVLLVAADRRARVRRDALRLAGTATGPRFAPVVAVTALAAAGRLALVAVPNVSLTYVLVFVGGLVYGPAVGFAGGLLAMALTDFLLSGLLPTVYANAPAMALIGVAGGLLRRVDFVGDGRDAAAGRVLAAALGVFATFGFSVAVDTLDWLLVPEFRGDWDLWRVRVLAGLAFNVVPALTNGALFAVAVSPVQRAFRALHGETR